MFQLLKEVLYFARQHMSDLLRAISTYAFMAYGMGYVMVLAGWASTEAVLLHMMVFAFFQPFLVGLLVKRLNYILTEESYSAAISHEEWRYLFLVYILYSLATSAGFLLFIVPGLIFLARFSLASIFVTLERQRPIEAMKLSWESTQGHTSSLIGGTLLIMLPVILLNIALNSWFEDYPSTLAITELMSAIVSVLTFVVLKVFYFRVYTLAKTTNDA